MEIARLVLDYLEVLVWPLVVGATLVGFRDRIGRLIDRVRSAKIAGIEAAFDTANAIATDPGLSPDERARLLSEVLQAVPTANETRKAIRQEIKAHERETMRKINSRTRSR